MSKPIYVVPPDHPLLTEKVLKLVDKPQAAPNDRFTMQQIVAEALLGAKAPAFTDADAVTMAEIAIVRQMNFQVEQGLDPFTQESATSTRSQQGVVWRDRFLDPVAAQLWASIGTGVTLDQLLGQFSSSLRSVRTDGAGVSRTFDPNCSDRILEARYWRHGT